LDEDISIPSSYSGGIEKTQNEQSVIKKIKQKPFQ